MAEPGAETQQEAEQTHEQVGSPVEQNLEKRESQTETTADEPAVQPTGAEAAADGRSSNHSSPAEDTPQPAAEAPAQPAPESAVKPAEEGHEQQQPVDAPAAAEEEGEKEVVSAPLAPTPAEPQHSPAAEVQAEDQQQQHEAHEGTEEQESLQQEEQQQAQGVQEPEQHIPAQHAQRAHKQVSHAAAAAAHSPGSTHGGYGTFPDRAANGKALTFTAPPYVPVAKPYRRVDYSHSSVQLLKISHDNQLLVNHLTTISKAVPAWTNDVNAPPAPGNTASSAVNRRKAATTIAQENHALYQRLVAIRPSKDISRDTLEAGHRKNETYRANCAQFKSTSPTRKAAAQH